MGEGDGGMVCAESGVGVGGAAVSDGGWDVGVGSAVGAGGDVETGSALLHALARTRATTARAAMPTNFVLGTPCLPTANPG